MKFEKSAGAIVFCENINKESTSHGMTREYLLLAHNSMNKAKVGKEKIIWDFPKGLISEGEKEIETAWREVAEETGLSEFSLVEGFRETLKIFYKFEGDFINKTVVYFLAQTSSSDDVRISFEHTDFAWLSFTEATKQLSFKNSRELLQKAEDFLAGTVTEPQQMLGL